MVDPMNMYKKILFVFPERKEISRGGKTTNRPKKRNVGPRNLKTLRPMFICAYCKSSQILLYLYRKLIDDRPL